MIGPYDKNPGSNEIILRALKGQVQLCPVGGKNFVDVRDAAVATCNALTRGIPGECYLLASENMTFADFFRKVNSLYGREGLRIMIPGGLLNCAGLLGNAYKSCTHRDISLNLVNTRQLSNQSYFSAKKAVRVLGMPQRPVDDAIRAAISWFIDNEYLQPVSANTNTVPAVA
jgi:dihydroflavonol-4-reductase